MKKLRTTLILAIAALLAVLAPTAVGTAGAKPNDGPPITPEQRAAALARPSLVYVETEWSAYVFDGEGALLNDGEPYEYTSSCSGFVVNAEGYVATAGHCVDAGNRPGGFSYDLVAEVAKEEWTRYGLGTYISLEAYTRYAHANWKVEGETKNSEPDRTVTVHLGVARANLMDSKELKARIVDFKPSADGDVALLKVEQPNLPTLEIAPPSERAEVGEQVLAIGYPAVVNDMTDGNGGLEPTSKANSVSSHQTSGGIPVIDVGTPFEEGMSGGPVVDFGGRVIGVISFRPTDSQGINFAINASVLRELMSQNGIENRLGPLDTMYREGLAQFYAGDYREAIENFSRVIAAVPWHAQAQGLRQQANELLAKENASAGGGGLPLGMVAGGAVLVLGFAGGLVFVRRGRKGTPSASADAARDGLGADSAEPAAMATAGSAEPTAEPRTDVLTTSAPEPSTNGHALVEEGSVQTLAPPSAPRVCRNCGSAQEPNANFCPTCGTRVGESTV